MSLLACFSRFLSHDTPAEIQKNVSLYMASIMFKTNGPIHSLEPEYMETLILHDNCFNYGAIRLWVLDLHRNDDSIPEKAKMFYNTQPRNMKHKCIETICDGTFDIYTLAHLFSDYYAVNVFINKINIQEHGGWDMKKSKQHKYSVYITNVDGNCKLVLPKKKRIRSSVSSTEVVTAKYALRYNTPGKNEQLGLFVPQSRHVWFYTDMNSGTYTIFPPNGSQKITFDEELYLFTQNGHLITIYKVGQPEYMYFTLSSKTKLYLVEARSESEARNKLTF